MLGIYKANRTSGSIKYIALAGLYLNHIYMKAATGISLDDFIVYTALIILSLMFTDLPLTKSVLAITAMTHIVFVFSERQFNVSAPEVVLLLLALSGFILATFGSLRICKNTLKSIKSDSAGITCNFRHIGDIANYIYGKVTQLGSEIQVLKNGSSEFRGSLEAVTRAVEEIADCSLSVVSDTEKIASHISELEKTLADNQEHIKLVTDNMDKIISYKNQGLRLMSELRSLTEAMSDAIAEIGKMVNETNINTEKIVSAGETLEQISAQTNILALNAAIEASKAGQSSKGFAVIADEIRKLSDETNRYLSEIQVYTEALTESVVNAVKALDKVNSAIENEISGVKDMDSLLDMIHESTTSTQNCIDRLNESGYTILGQAVKVKEAITNLCNFNEECSAKTLQSSNSLHNQNPYVGSIIKLIDNLYEMAYNLRDKSMEIKMLIDAGQLVDFLENEGYSNDSLIEGCRRLNITTAYVADKTGYVHYCNEEIGRGVNLFSFDKSLEQLLNGVDYIVTPIKQRAEDGKPYKLLSVYRNDKICELGLDLSQTCAGTK